MRWLLILALAACKTTDDGDDFPVNPGGGSHGTGEIIDAAPIDAPSPDGGGTLNGRVCLVTDLRGLACAATGAGGIVVTLGTKSATTTANGAFSIGTPGGSNLVWRATGAAIATSVMAFGPSNTIPAIGVEDYLDLQLENSVIQQAGQGAIFARIVRNGLPVTGATAAASPQAQFATKYDGTTPNVWPEGATSAAGVAWIAGVDAGTPNVIVNPASGTGATEPTLVVDQAITYTTIELP
jgi:hypothetical protein